MMTAEFSLYGQKGQATRATAKGRVRFDPTVPGHDKGIAALAARIERETRCQCYPVRLDSWAADGSSSTFEITLVRPVSRKNGEGLSVMGSLWATVFTAK